MASRKGSLRAVGQGETARPEPKTLLEAVTDGDYLAELKATHQRIARAVNNPETAPRDLASLTRRQIDISKEIRALTLALEQEAASAEEVTDGTFDSSAV